MTPERTPEGRWVIYECATGKRLLHWPVDARGMLASGDFTADPPEGATVPDAATVSAAPPVPLATVSEHALGGPAVVMRSEDAPPARPVTIPTARRSRDH